MQTDNITITCLNNTDGSGFNCTTPAIFSGGDMFISLLLIIGLVLAIISMVQKGIFSVSVHKEYTGVNEIEGKHHYKL
jgi:hypothetical protein